MPALKRCACLGCELHANACPELVPRGTARCRGCARVGDRGRGTRQQRGYGAEHERRFRRNVLARHPVCQLCPAQSTVADHWPLSRRELVAQGLDPNDPRYGRGLCASCHSRETAARQPGGWNKR